MSAVGDEGGQSEAEGVGEQRDGLLHLQRERRRSRRILDVLVFPAASRPSMRRRISRDPKILPMIFDT